MKKHLDGFIRFNNGMEINWSIYDWALPLGISFSTYTICLQFFCVYFFFPRKINNNQLGEIVRW